MYWMRKRLGSAGAARLRILETVRRESPEVWDTAVTPIGLTPDQLVAFSARHELPCMANYTALRGDTRKLESIAWWGSAIADVVMVSHSAVRVRAMEEAAAFNLAVALFDSVVEHETRSAQQLMSALAPDRMRRRLDHPAESGAALNCADPLASRIARLFDFTLASVGGRCCTQPVGRAEMAALLEGMYLGATSVSGDPMLAKRGPVIFIGLLADLNGGRASRLLALALATFCQQWDDWQDMAEDLRVLSPNSFLGVPPRRFHIATVGYAGNAAIRLVGGRWCHPRIAKVISSSVVNVLAAARDISSEHHNKATSLCHALIV
jgi:hypothetical protein